MKIIAVEEHFGFPEIGAGGKAEQDILCPHFHSSYANAWPLPHVPVPGSMQDIAAGRIADMDANGIDVQILSSNSTQLIVTPEAVPICRAANDKLAAAVAQHPGRFYGFASLPTIDPTAAADELERTVKEYGFRGANLFGRTAGKFLDDPVFEPLLARAEALGVPLYLHPGFPPREVADVCYEGFSDMVSTRFACAGWGWHADGGVQVLRMILGGVFDRHPDLTIVSGHWGEMVPWYLERLQEAMPKQITGLQKEIPEYYQSNIYVTPSGMFSNAQLKYIIELLGADRVMFSVDYPFIPNAGARAFLENAPLRQEDKEKIAFRNAEKVFRL